jgi:Na+-transporting NADH:ubiquinone oxidoreductase subunit NqrE
MEFYKMEIWNRQKLGKGAKLVARFKSYYMRASHYVGMMNFLMILATLKQAYGLNISVWVMIPVGIFGVLLVGWFDYKYIMSHQIKYDNKMNDLKIQLDRIENILIKQEVE